MSIFDPPDHKILKRIRLDQIDDETLQELTDFCNELDFTTFPEAERFVKGKYKTLYGIYRILERMKEEGMDDEIDAAMNIILKGSLLGSAGRNTSKKPFKERVKRKSRLMASRFKSVFRGDKEQEEKALEKEDIRESIEDLKEKYERSHSVRYLHKIANLVYKLKKLGTNYSDDVKWLGERWVSSDVSPKVEPLILDEIVGYITTGEVVQFSKMSENKLTVEDIAQIDFIEELAEGFEDEKLLEKGGDVRYRLGVIYDKLGENEKSDGSYEMAIRDYAGDRSRDAVGKILNVVSEISDDFLEKVVSRMRENEVNNVAGLLSKVRKNFLERGRLSTILAHYYSSKIESISEASTAHRFYGGVDRSPAFTGYAYAKIEGFYRDRIEELYVMSLEDYVRSGEIERLRKVLGEIDSELLKKVNLENLEDEINSNLEHELAFERTLSLAILSQKVGDDERAHRTFANLLENYTKLNIPKVSSVLDEVEDLDGFAEELKRRIDDGTTYLYGLLGMVYQGMGKNKLASESFVTFIKESAGFLEFDDVEWISNVIEDKSTVASELEKIVQELKGSAKLNQMRALGILYNVSGSSKAGRVFADLLVQHIELGKIERIQKIISEINDKNSVVQELEKLGDREEVLFAKGMVYQSLGSPKSSEVFADLLVRCVRSDRLDLVDEILTKIEDKTGVLWELEDLGEGNEVLFAKGLLYQSMSTPKFNKTFANLLVRYVQSDRLDLVDKLLTKINNKSEVLSELEKFDERDEVLFAKGMVYQSMGSTKSSEVFADLLVRYVRSGRFDWVEKLLTKINDGGEVLRELGQLEKDDDTLFAVALARQFFDPENSSWTFANLLGRYAESGKFRAMKSVMDRIKDKEGIISYLETETRNGWNKYLEIALGYLKLEKGDKEGYALLGRNFGVVSPEHLEEFVEVASELSKNVTLGPDEKNIYYLLPALIHRRDVEKFTEYIVKYSIGVSVFDDTIAGLINPKERLEIAKKLKEIADKRRSSSNAGGLYHIAGLLFHAENKVEEYIDCSAKMLEEYAKHGDEYHRVSLYGVDEYLEDLGDYKESIAKKIDFESMENYILRSSGEQSGAGKEGFESIGLLYYAAGKLSLDANDNSYTKFYAKALENLAKVGDLDSFRKVSKTIDKSKRKFIAERINFDSIKESIEKNLKKGEYDYQIARGHHALGVLYQLKSDGEKNEYKRKHYIKKAAEHFALATKYYGRWWEDKGIPSDISNKSEIAREFVKIADEWKSSGEDWKNIGRLYRAAGLLSQEVDDENYIEYFAETLGIYAIKGDLNSVRGVLDDINELTRETVAKRIDFKSIEESIEESIRNNEDPSQITKKHHAAGILYQLKGNYEKAGKHFAKALEYNATKGNLQSAWEVLKDVDESVRKTVAKMINFESIEESIEEAIKKRDSAYQITEKHHAARILYQWRDDYKNAGRHLAKVLEYYTITHAVDWIRGSISDINEPTRKAVAEAIDLDSVEKSLKDIGNKNPHEHHALGILYQLKSNYEKNDDVRKHYIEKAAEHFALAIRYYKGRLEYKGVLRDVSSKSKVAREFVRIADRWKKNGENERDIRRLYHAAGLLSQEAGYIKEAAEYFAFAIKHGINLESVLEDVSNKSEIAREFAKIADGLRANKSEESEETKKDWEYIGDLYRAARLLTQEIDNDDHKRYRAKELEVYAIKGDLDSVKKVLNNVDKSTSKEVAERIDFEEIEKSIKESIWNKENPFQIAMKHRATGILYQLKGKYRKASEHFVKVLEQHANPPVMVGKLFEDEIDEPTRKHIVEMIDFDSIEESIKKSIEDRNKTSWIAGKHHEIAVLYQLKGDSKISVDKMRYIEKAAEHFALAIRYYEGGLEYKGVLRDVSSKSKVAREFVRIADRWKKNGENERDIRRLYHAAGLLSQEAGYIKEAAEYFAFAIKHGINLESVLEDVSNKSEIAREFVKIADEWKSSGDDWENIGRLYHAAGLLSQEIGDGNYIRYFAKAFENYAKAGNLDSIGILNSDINEQKRKLVVEEIKFDSIEKSIKKSKGVDTYLITRKHHAIGILYKFIGNSRKARDHFTKALEYYAKKGATNKVQEILNTLDNKSLPLDLYSSIYQHAKSSGQPEIYRCFFMILSNSNIRTSDKETSPKIIENPSNVLEQMINNVNLRKYVSEIFELYPNEFNTLISEKTAELPPKTISSLEKILPQVTPYERLGLIKLATIKPQDVPESEKDYRSLLHDKSKEYGVKILNMNTLLLLEKASKEQIDALKLTHPLLYDLSLENYGEVSDTSMPLNMQNASNKVKEKYKQLSILRMPSEAKEINIGKGLSLLYQIVGETEFLNMSNEELKVSGEFLTHLTVDKKDETSRFDSKSLLISYILRKSNFDRGEVSNAMDIFLNNNELEHALFTYHGTTIKEFNYRGLPLAQKAYSGFYSANYGTASEYGQNIHFLTDFLFSSIGIQPRVSYSESQDKINEAKSVKDIYLNPEGQVVLTDSLGGVTTLPHNFLIPISDPTETYSILKKFNELSRKTEGELKDEVLESYKIDEQTFNDISALYSEMLNLGYSEAISLDLAYSLLEGETKSEKTQLMKIFRSMKKTSSKSKSFGPFKPIDVSYLVSFYVIKNEFYQEGKVLTHRFPTYIEYGDDEHNLHRLNQGIRLYLTKKVDVNEIDDITIAKEFLDDLYMESYKHYSKHAQSKFKYSITGDPKKVFVEIWRNIWKINGTYVDEVAKASGKHKPFIESNVPLACGSAGRHEMVPGSSDFELGSIVIDGKSNEAIVAASSKVRELDIPESDAVSIKYNPKTKEIEYPNEAYQYAELFDAVPLIDPNDNEQREAAIEFRLELLDKLAQDNSVLDALKADLTSRRHFIERTMRGHLRMSDLSSQSVFKHTLYRFAMLLPKVMFIEYYKTNPKFREYVQNEIKKDPMVPLFSYREISSWMKVGSGKEKFPAPLWMGEVILTSRALMYQFWAGINKEYGINASIVSPTYVGWLIPPNFQSVLNLLVNESMHQYSEAASAYIPEVSMEKPEILKVV